MHIHVIAWDDDDDPNGNVRHIEAAELTPAEVDEVLYAHEGGPDDFSESSGLPMVFGTTSTGKRIVVVYDDQSDDDLVVIYPVTAYTVPEYGG